MTATCAAFLAGPVQSAFAGSCGPPVPPSPARIAVGQFTNLGVEISSGTLFATVRWGDGAVQSHTFAPNVPFTYTHRYTAPGTYRVTIDDRGTNGDGVSCLDVGQLQGLVTVVGPPAAARPCWAKPSFTLAGKTARAGVPFTWSNSNPNWPNLTETVSWGDGTAIDTAAIAVGQMHQWSHTYATAGTYEIRRHVAATFSNGTPCQHDESLGKITVLGPAGQACLFNAPAAIVPNASIGQVAWAFRLADGKTWRFGSTDLAASVPTPTGNSWSQTALWPAMWRALSTRSPAYQWYRCANVSSTSPAAAESAAGAQFASAALSATDNNLTKTLAILRAYGVQLPAATAPTLVNNYFNATLAGFTARQAVRPATHTLLPSSSGPTCARAVSKTAYWHHQIAIRHRAIRRARTPQAKKRAQQAYARAQRSWKRWRAAKRSAC